MPDEGPWITLYNPTQQESHRVPDSPVVVQDFRDRGWETPDDTAARLEAEAADLHGKELDAALEAEDLPKSGPVADKQKRLAEKRVESVTPNEGTEGDQV